MGTDLSVYHPEPANCTPSKDRPAGCRTFTTLLIQGHITRSTARLKLVLQESSDFYVMGDGIFVGEAVQVFPL